MSDIEICQTEDIKTMMMKYAFALQMLETQLRGLIKEYELKKDYNPVEHIKSRIKTLDSSINKLKRKGYEINVENIKNHVHDIIGIRIVCSFITDIYDIVNIIEKSGCITIVEKKDYITTPKETGYSSYHLIVKMPIYLADGKEEVEAEIQIRTSAMDFWASLDHKIQYKFSSNIPERVKQEMYNCSIDIKNLDHKMEILNTIVNNYYK